MRERDQIIIGSATLLAGALFVAWVSFAGGLANSERGYILEAEFRQVDGLKVGAPVLLSGMQVGEVRALRLQPERLRPLVEMRIRNGIRVPTDSAVLVLSDGLLGDKFVQIEAGAEESKLEEGGRFQFVQDSVIVEQVLERIIRNAERHQGSPSGTRDGGQR